MTPRREVIFLMEHPPRPKQSEKLVSVLYLEIVFNNKFQLGSSSCVPFGSPLLSPAPPSLSPAPLRWGRSVDDQLVRTLLTKTCNEPESGGELADECGGAAHAGEEDAFGGESCGNFVNCPSYQVHELGSLGEKRDVNDVKLSSEMQGLVEVLGNGSSSGVTDEDAPSPRLIENRKQQHLQEQQWGRGTECLSSTTAQTGGIEPTCLPELEPGEDVTRTGEGSGQARLEGAHAFSSSEADARMMLGAGDPLFHGWRG